MLLNKLETILPFPNYNSILLEFDNIIKIKYY